MKRRRVLSGALALWGGACLCGGAALGSVPQRVLRPVARPQVAGFEPWLAEVRARAVAQGLPSGLVSRALAGLQPDPRVIARDRSQSEFTRTLWAYLDTAVSAARVRNGRAALARYDPQLRRIEARFGVDPAIVTAIWGLESAYGAVRGDMAVLRSLATLGFDRRRGAFFEAQLIAALTILARGDTTADRLRGSWAGAMGHTQFMPTSYLEHAVDWQGDGRRDIWGDDPLDALASTAAYLRAHGWQRGVPWGQEVRLPKGFDHAQADRRITKAPRAWASMGLRAASGGALAEMGAASVLLPAGHRGAAFLISENFAALESYNTADSYVIAVGHLADRLRGAGPLVGGWPYEDRALTFAERQELQRRLTARGHDTQGVDGLVGPLTVDAIRSYQQGQGLVPDGYASPALLERLR